MVESAQPNEWLVGGGEMGELIRSIDWSKTPLGPTGSWPESLRTAVSICLGSRHPIVLWWGPERWMFYNDAYRPMLGERKHPQFLGRPGQGCWPEIWDIIGPMMDQVIATGEATWSEDLLLLMLRHGYLEETYFTFSYSPIRDERGRSRGIFNACTESTARVLGERRLRTLRGMAVEARTTKEAARLCAEALGQNARDMPFVLVYLLDDAAKALELAGHFGLEPGTPASPSTVAVNDESPNGWPLARVSATGRAERVDVLAYRFDCLPAAPWDEPAHEAMVLPIPRAGTEHPAGVLVLGINPRRAFDDDFRGFFELVVGHVATAIANARAYEAERKRAEALAEVDRAKTAFFDNVSHEFRTPLTLILGPIEDAIEAGVDGGSLVGESLQSVHRNALRMLRLVNSLLDFSRVEAGRLSVSFRPTDLAALTAGLVGSFQSLVEDAGLRLTVDCPALPEAVYVDHSHWEKIVLNLVSNAFKFTFEGEITVGLTWHDDHVELRVSDTGTGIPEAELPRIFERFHRVEGARSRSFEGTGIGLALVQDLVKLHGGTVSVSSSEGKGTTFVVSIPTGTAPLPREQPTHAIAPEPRATDISPYLLEALHWSTPGSVEPGAVLNVEMRATPDAVREREVDRILVADDNADMLDYLVRLLRPHWRVDAVGDGRAALVSARSNPPDLIVSDVMMPEMDGVALLGALRADSRTNTIPVILLSARAGEEAVLSGLEMGADDYLVKPFSARELVTRVRTHLEMQRVRREAADATRELAEARASLVRELEQKNLALGAANSELRETQAQLVQSAKMASLGELVAGVAHEINNPLAFALSHVGTVEQSLGRVRAQVKPDRDDGVVRDWEKALHRLRELRVGLERIRDLVLRLRTFSRLDEGELKRVSMKESIQSVLTILGHRIRENITVVLECGEPDQVECYPGPLNQAILNLVANAIESIEGRGRVTISTGSEGDSYAVLVADTGSGIPESIRDRVLEPFFTTKPVGKGTGLGLSITYAIAKKHGGDLKLSQRPEGGTIASIRFPFR